MGCQSSRDCWGSRSVRLFNVNNFSSNRRAADAAIQGRAVIDSYQEACRIDPGIRSFDSSLRERMSHAVSVVTSDPQLNIHALSFDSIMDVTGCLLYINQEAVKVILESKEDIWNNRGLFELVREYLDNSKQTMDFCSALEGCLNRVRDRVVIAQSALRYFQEEEEEEADSDGKRKYRKTLDEFRRFREAGNPFTDEFFQTFEAVRTQQLAMLAKLRLQRKKLRKKMKSVKSWRKVSSVIFMSSVAAILICSVVAAALAAPPVAAALAAAAAVPLGSMGKWIDSLWNAYEQRLNDQEALVTTMQLRTFHVKSELDDIKVQVDKLQIHLESLLSNADFALRGDEAVRFGVEEIEKKLDAFMKSVDDLGKKADQCSRDALKARAVVLRRIVGHANGN